jgi:hypothetical protein
MKPSYYYDSKKTVFVPAPYGGYLAEKQQLHVQIFSMNRPVLKPAIYCIRGENANHYITKAACL